jgi:predicted acyltransferase
MGQKVESKRLLALDVMRGITISGMILVNYPGNYASTYAPLKHAEWNGLTPTDLVFPFFMFIMGVSMYLSLSKSDFVFSPRLAMKILKQAYCCLDFVGYRYRLVLVVLLLLVDSSRTTIIF